MKTINKRTFFWGIIISIFLVACSEDSPTTPKDEIESKTLGLVFTSDYVNGELRWFDIEADSLSPNKITLAQDSRVIVQGSQVFVLERFGADNLVRLDPSKLDQEDASVLYQTSLEDGSNPSDLIALDSQTAWLGLEGSAHLLKINTAVSAKGKTLKTVDLSKYTVSGNISPNLIKLSLKGDTLLALLQRLDMYQAKLPGLIVLLDANEGTILDTIPLKTNNPTSFAWIENVLWVSTQGVYNDVYGCNSDSLRGIESIDFEKKKSTVKFFGKNLGGGVSSFTVDQKNKKIYASVLGVDGGYSLAKVDIEKNKISLLDEIEDTSGSLYWDANSDLLFVGDRSFENAKLWGYDGSSFFEIKGKDVLPPYNMAVISYEE